MTKPKDDAERLAYLLKFTRLGTSIRAVADNKDLAFTGPEINGMIWGPGEAFGIRKEDSVAPSIPAPASAVGK